LICFPFGKLPKVFLVMLSVCKVLVVMVVGRKKESHERSARSVWSLTRSYTLVVMCEESL